MYTYFFILFHYKVFCQVARSVADSVADSLTCVCEVFLSWVQMAVAWLDAQNSDSTQTNEPQEFAKPSCERRPQGRNDELTGLELFPKSIFLKADQKATLSHFQHWGVSTRILAPLFSNAESRAGRPCLSWSVRNISPWFVSRTRPRA